MTPSHRAENAADPPSGGEGARPLFPTHAYPAALDQFARETAAAIDCDVSMIAVPVLSVLGAAIGTTRSLVVKRGFEVPPIVWTAVVSESGTAKSPALKAVQEPLLRIDSRHAHEFRKRLKIYEAEKPKPGAENRDRRDQARAGGSAAAPPVRPICQRIHTSDTTVEALVSLLAENPRGLLVSRDELSGWYGSMDRYTKGGGKAGSGDEPFYLSAFEAGSHTCDCRTGTPPSIHVPRAAVCVTGGIQPDILKSAMGDRQRADGMLARFVLAFPPSRVARLTRAVVSPDCQEAYANLVARLYFLRHDLDVEGSPEPIRVTLEPKAYDVYEAFNSLTADEMESLTGELRASWAKLRGIAARFALILHESMVALGEKDGNVVDCDTMERAVEIAQWCKQEHRRAYTSLGWGPAGASRGADHARDADRKTLEWLCSRPPKTAREVEVGCRWLDTSKDAAACLDRLHAAGLGYWRPRTNSNVGRATREFVVGPPPNDHVLSAEPPESRAWEGFADADASSREAPADAVVCWED